MICEFSRQQFPEIKWIQKLMLPFVGASNALYQGLAKMLKRFRF